MQRVEERCLRLQRGVVIPNRFVIGFEIEFRHGGMIASLRDKSSGK